MLKTIALVVAVLIAGLLIFASTKPDTFSVQRSTTINAPPEKVFAVLNDFHRWPELAVEPGGVVVRRRTWVRHQRGKEEEVVVPSAEPAVGDVGRCRRRRGSQRLPGVIACHGEEDGRYPDYCHAAFHLTRSLRSFCFEV